MNDPNDFFRSRRAADRGRCMVCYLALGFTTLVVFTYIAISMGALR